MSTGELHPRKKVQNCDTYLMGLSDFWVDAKPCLPETHWPGAGSERVVPSQTLRRSWAIPKIILVAHLVDRWFFLW